MGPRPTSYGVSECVSGWVGGMRGPVEAAGVSVPALAQEVDVGDPTAPREVSIYGCF